MSEMRYCYHCRIHHHEDQMQRILTSRGYRWRCTRSIEAARQDVAARDAFGQVQTKINRDMKQWQAELAHRTHFAPQGWQM